MNYTYWPLYSKRRQYFAAVFGWVIFRIAELFIRFIKQTTSVRTHFERWTLFLFRSYAMLEQCAFTFVDLKENGNNWSQQNVITLITSNKYFVGTEKLKTKTRYFRLVGRKKNHDRMQNVDCGHMWPQNAQVNSASCTKIKCFPNFIIALSQFLDNWWNGT